MADRVTLDDVDPLAPTPEDELYAEEVRNLKAARLELELDDLASNIEHRRRYASRIFVFLSVWMAMVFGVILADGWSLWGLDISEKVLLTLIGGTTLNIIGIFAIVANYFFPKK